MNIEDDKNNELKSLEIQKTNILVNPTERLQNIYDIHKNPKREVSNADVLTLLENSQNRTTLQNKMIFDVVKEIHEVVKPKKKVKGKALPLREAVTPEIYYYLMAQKRDPLEKIISQCRFRVAITILWYSGLRINEIKDLTRDDIHTILVNHDIQIYQPKVNRYKKVVFPQRGVVALQNLSKEIDVLFKKYETLSGGCTNLSWIRLLNLRLKKYTEGRFKNIRSHSFRVGYTTNLLKQVPLQDASLMIGHRDIKTTLKYNRYIPNRVQHTLTLDKIFA